jgi:diguanylate cyclase (GGDEF)-like protein
MVSTDGLTGIANRRHFEERYKDEWRRAMREEIPLAVIMIDIDYFKKYNDFYGHIGGDDCLRRVAQTLSRTISRAGDLVARCGGEEFAVLLPNTDNVGAIVVAEALRSAVNQLELEHYGSPSRLISISLGVAASFPRQGGDSDELLKRADQALYQAKAAGRNNVRSI